MRILWIVNMVPDAFAEKILHKRQNYQGWINGLSVAFSKFLKHIDLSIAFEHNEDITETINGVHYYAVSTQQEDLSSRMSRLIRESTPDIIHFHGSEGKFTSLPRDTWRNVHTCMSLQGIINGYSPQYMGGIHEYELKKCTYRIKKCILPLLGIRCLSTMDEAKEWDTTRSAKEADSFLKVKSILGRTEWDKAWTSYLNPEATYYHVGEILRDPFYLGRRNESKVIPHTIYAPACLAYPLKGGHWLLRAVHALKDKYPDIKLHIPDAKNVKWPQNKLRHYFHQDYTIYLRNLIKELNIENNVVLHPSLEATAVVEQLSKAAVFCLPSTAENSPNSLCEAAMIGTPIVATDVGGVSTLVDNKKEALLVPASDPAALAYSIDILFSNPTLANQLASAAFKRISNQCNPSDICKQIEAAYQKILCD